MGSSNLRALAVLCLALNLLVFHAGAEEKSLTSEQLVALAAKLDALTLVTPAPVQMSQQVYRLCRRITLNDKDHAEVVHNRYAFYRVYVTPDGADAMKDRAATFPVGAVLLKQKLAQKDDTAALLYTGMLKREKGFNLDCGDWEFFLLSGDGKSVTERGKISSCMDCHTLYPKSDFVTKSYK